MNLVMLSISIHVAGRTEKAARDDVRKEAMPTLPTGRERVLSRKCINHWVVKQAGLHITPVRLPLPTVNPIINGIVPSTHHSKPPFSITVRHPDQKIVQLRAHAHNLGALTKFVWQFPPEDSPLRAQASEYHFDSDA